MLYFLLFLIDSSRVLILFFNADMCFRWMHIYATYSAPKQILAYRCIKVMWNM